MKDRENKTMTIITLSWRSWTHITKDIRKLKKILSESFKDAFSEANSAYPMEKQPHKRCGLYFKKSLTLSELQRLELLLSQL